MWWNRSREGSQELWNQWWKSSRDSTMKKIPTNKWLPISSKQSGLDFKRRPPTIRDEDPDLDRYDRAFDNMVACYSFGTRKFREVDKLHMYSEGFKEGSTRREVYDNALRRAGREKRDRKTLEQCFRKSGWICGLTFGRRQCRKWCESMKSSMLWSKVDCPMLTLARRRKASSRYGRQ
jgi:hypothetical protein